MRVLGLDFGSQTVKAVEFESSFRKFEVHDYYELAVTEDSNPFLTARKLLDQLPRKPEKIAVAVPQGASTFRRLTLPTKDRKAIHSAITFELEDELPFPSEETHFDYSILSQVKTETQIHIEVSLKKHIAEFLYQLSEVEIEPDLVTSQPWAYRSILNQTLTAEENEEPCILVDFGHRESKIYLHWKGQALAFRTLKYGGRDLTEAIGSRYNVDFQEARKVKLESGFVMATPQKEGASREQLEFSDTVMNSLHRIILEIRQMGLAAKNLTELPPRAIYLTGKSCMLPGFKYVVEEATHIPAQQLRSLSAISNEGVNYSEENDIAFCLAAGLGLSQIAPQKIKPINFRKGSFAKAGQGMTLDMNALRGPMVLAASIGISLMVSLSLQSWFYSSQIEDIEGQLKRSVKNFFGGALPATVLRNYLKTPTTLKKKIEGELEKERLVASLFKESQKSPIQFLNSLSGSLKNRKWTIDMIEFNMGSSPSAPFDQNASQDVKLTFLADKKETLDQIEKVLAGALETVKKSEPAEVAGPDGGAKRWKATFEGKAKDSFYVR